MIGGTTTSVVAHAFDVPGQADRFAISGCGKGNVCCSTALFQLLCLDARDVGERFDVWVMSGVVVDAFIGESSTCTCA